MITTPQEIRDLIYGSCPFPYVNIIYRGVGVTPWPTAVEVKTPYGKEKASPKSEEELKAFVDSAIDKSNRFLLDKWILKHSK